MSQYFERSFKRSLGLALFALSSACDLFNSGGTGGIGTRDRDTDLADCDVDGDCDTGEVCTGGACEAESGGGGGGECTDDPDAADPVCLATGELCLGTSCVVPEDVTCAGLGQTFLDIGGALLIEPSWELFSAGDAACDGDLGVFFFVVVADGFVGTANATAVSFAGAPGFAVDVGEQDGEFFFMNLCAPAGTVVGDITTFRLLTDDGLSSNVVCGELAPGAP